jgi:hypothetical protein
MAGIRILLPHNFSRTDEKAIRFVGQTFAQLKEADITLLHVYVPPPRIEAAKNTVEARMQENLSHIHLRLEEQKQHLETVKATLASSGFETGRIHVVFRPRKRDVAAEILHQAVQDRADVVVLNRKPEKTTRFFSSNVFNRVVSGVKGVTVCVVS